MNTSIYLVQYNQTLELLIISFLAILNRMLQNY